MSAMKEYDEIKDILAASRPDLLDTFPPTTSSLSQVGKFLDEHFPLPDGWGCRSIAASPSLLREQLKDAK